MALFTTIATTGFSLAKKAGLGKKAKQAVAKGFGLLKDRVSEKLQGVKFSATEKGFRLTGNGFSAQGGQAAQGGGAVLDSVQSQGFLPYIIGGVLLLMFLKK